MSLSLSVSPASPCQRSTLTGTRKVGYDMIGEKKKNLPLSLSHSLTLATMDRTSDQGCSLKTLSLRIGLIVKQI